MCKIAHRFLNKISSSKKSKQNIQKVGSNALERMAEIKGNNLGTSQEYEKSSRKRKMEDCNKVEENRGETIMSKNSFKRILCPSDDHPYSSSSDAYTPFSNLETMQIANIERDNNVGEVSHMNLYSHQLTSCSKQAQTDIMISNESIAKATKNKSNPYAVAPKPAYGNINNKFNINVGKGTIPMLTVGIPTAKDMNKEVKRNFELRGDLEKELEATLGQPACEKVFDEKSLGSSFARRINSASFDSTEEEICYQLAQENIDVRHFMEGYESYDEDDYVDVIM